MTKIIISIAILMATSGLFINWYLSFKLKKGFRESLDFDEADLTKQLVYDKELHR